MTMVQAIAMSASNKARTTSDEGDRIIVQERYSSVSETWLHVWRIKGTETYETDIPLPHPVQLKSSYGVDPDEKYWTDV